MIKENSKSKICSFTQTYSDGREELFNFHDNDNVDLYFRNKLDDNFYVFHNCSENYINKIENKKYLNSISKKQIISLNNITYTESVLKTLSLIKAKGFKYIIFLQDDVFCMVDNETIDNLLLFIENNNFNMLNIEYNNINNEKEIISKQSSINVYNTNSIDFTKKNFWAMDDSPFVANVDFLMSVIYDNTYFSLNDIWTAEAYMNSKIWKNPVQRLSTNISFFIRVNIVGRNICVNSIKNGLELLEKKFNI